MPASAQVSTCLLLSFDQYRFVYDCFAIVDIIEAIASREPGQESAPVFHLPFRFGCQEDGTCTYCVVLVRLGTKLTAGNPSPGSAGSGLGRRGVGAAGDRYIGGGAVQLFQDGRKSG